MLRRIASNWARIFTGIVVVYVATPFTIHTLEEEAYGVWLMIANLASYLGLLSLGAPLASVRYVAKYAAEDNTTELQNTASTLWMAYLGMAAIAVALGAGLVVAFPAVWDVGSAGELNARVALGLAVIYWAVSLMAHWPRGILSAYQEFPSINVAAIAGLAMRLVLTLGVLMAWPTVIGLGVALVGSVLIEVTILAAYMRKHYPGIRPRTGSFTKGTLKEIGGFSLFAFALNFGAQLAYMSDALIIGTFVGIEVIVFYTVAHSLTQYLNELIIAIAEVIMPAATGAYSRSKLRTLRATCYQWTKISYSLTSLAALNLLLWGPGFLDFWIEEGYSELSGPILIALTLSLLVFLPMRGVAQPILLGIGKPKAPTVTFLATAVINVIVSIILSGPLGLMGVAIGTVVQNVLYGIALYVLVSRELALSDLKFLWYSFGKTTIGAAAVYAAADLLAHRVDITSVFGMAAVGSVSVVLFAMVSVGFVYRNDPFVNLPKLGAQIWSRLRSRGGEASNRRPLRGRRARGGLLPGGPVMVTVSIDTEEDNWGIYEPVGATVKNILALEELQDHFDRFGARPTYLVNHAPLVDRDSVAVLGRLAERPNVEIGSHCHPWNTPPKPTGDVKLTMMCALSAQRNRAMIEEITRRTQTELGIRPTSFRAGRWGFGASVAKALEAEGYLLDASVSPFVDWTSEGGPDYRDVPHRPYRFFPERPFVPDPLGSLLEVPTSIGFLRGDHIRRAAVRQRIESGPLGTFHLVGLLDRAGLLSRRWLSPEVTSPADMEALARRCVAAGQTHLDLTFHSCTLLPGATPFVRDESDRNRFLESLGRALAFFTDMGFEFVTLAELGHRLSATSQSAHATGISP